MKTKHLSYSSSGKAVIRKAAEILRNGGLVGIPTETVYGLAANAFNPRAVEKIFKAKGRPQDNPLIVHIADYDDIMDIAEYIPFSFMQLAKTFWPGPLTMIVKKSEKIPDVVTCGMDTVAVRMPSHPIARKVIREAGVPLAAPSANLSGSPSPTCAQHVYDDMDGRIEAILDGGVCEVGVESTVISLAEETPILLRPGIISKEQMEQVIGYIDVHNAVVSKPEEGAKVASPGMKYIHYSPKTEIILVDTNDDSAFVNFVNSQDSSVGAMIYKSESGLFNVPSVVYGEKNDYDSQAHFLFEALRETDKLGVKTVYVRLPEQQGAALAVYNRLIRAAGYKIVKP